MIEGIRPNSQLKFFVAVLLPTLCLIAASFVWFDKHGEPNEHIIASDGKGYYQYLPELFLAVEPSKEGKTALPNGKTVNKYFIGTAICMSPFFALGCLIASLGDYPFDGYSFPFQLSISIAGIVYLLLGLWLLSKLLAQLQFSTKVILISIATIVFGTNLLNYGILDPSMSHIYSFTCITAFLYFSQRYFGNGNRKAFFIAILLLGLIVLIRPINAIVVFLLPFFLDSSNSYRWKDQIDFKSVALAFLLFGVVLSIQSIFWFKQTGNFLVWGYGKEGFYFSDPQIYEVLFGFRKGWFIYTPMALLALLGSIPLFRKSKQKAISLITFLFLLVYITSSWWNWFYGPSFSMRPFVDFYAVIAILFAYLLHSARQLQYQLVLFAAAFCISLNLFQTYQYEKVIMSSWDMNYEKYKAIFGVYEQGKVIIGGTHDLLPYNHNKELILESTFDFEKDQSSKSIYDSIIDAKVVNFDKLEYNLKIEKQLDYRAVSPTGLYLEVDLKRYEEQLNNSSKAKLIVDIKDSLGQSHHYYWTLLNEVPATAIGWKEWSYEMAMPPAKTNADLISVYIRNEEKKAFRISDFSFRLSSL